MNVLNKCLAHGDKMCDKYGLKIGRVLLAAIFLVSAYGKVTGFAGTAGFMESAGMPMASVLLVIAIIIEVAGGLALIFGWQVRHAVRALVIYTVVATYYFHMNLADQSQMIMFMKNLAIIGGLLVTAATASKCKNCAKSELAK